MVELFYLDDYRQAVREAAQRTQRQHLLLSFDSFDWARMPAVVVIDAANCTFIVPSPEPSG